MPQYIGFALWLSRQTNYQYFGKFAARLDDIANLIPARLCCLLVFFTGLFYAPARVFSKSGWRGLWGKTPFLWHYVTRKNAAEMASPNAIWSEWAFAQILNLKLGGLREYAGGITQKNEVGIGKDNIQFSDIHAALSLYRHVMLLLLLLTGISAILTFILQISRKSNRATRGSPLNRAFSCLQGRKAHEAQWLQDNLCR